MKNVLLPVLLVLSIGSFLLLGYGFAKAVGDILHPSGSGLPEPDGNVTETGVPDQTLLVVGLGDSLTRGVGDAEGLGYFGRVRQSLQQMGIRDVSFTNLAVRGATTADLLGQLQAEGVRYSLSRADVILLTIGGNDLFPGWQNLHAVDMSNYRWEKGKLLRNAKAILDRIRGLNPDCPVFWIGLYNPFEDIPELKGSSRIVREWNAALEELALDYPGVYVIPVFDLFQGQAKKVLYTDHFHPNDRGYELIAERVLQKLTLELDLDRDRKGEGSS